MVKQKPIDREKLKQVQEIEALLRASANSASKVVSAWLPDDDDGDKDDSNAGKKPTSAALKPRDIFKGRPARLGVGAKFLSHKEMMSNSQSGPGILSAEELRLKRKLTKGVDGKNTTTPLAEKRKSTDDRDETDDLDSRSCIVGSSGAAAAAAAKSSPVANPSNHNRSSAAAAPPLAKKKSKTSLFLDSLIKRRKK
ncbi:hypothetical protein IWW38_000061 [Coemansia aciculifera]|uniref:Uncharacterized protein n=1 Tax=Coemansia aciculifera TaxID=417176 RepID=A0ACC1MBS9_9FUNG|nr:hypothetical protein IWW38_000061 [Coemansia aciculifera]